MTSVGGNSEKQYIPPAAPLQQQGQYVPPPPPPQQQGQYVPPPPPPQQQGQTTVVVNQPNMITTFTPVNTNPFGPQPVIMQCPQCRAQITTTTRTKIGLMAWYIVMVLFFIGCGFPLIWLGFCFIPLCIPKLRDVIHSCPNCNTVVGKYPAGGIS